MVRQRALICVTALVGATLVTLASPAHAELEALPFQVHVIDSAECDARQSFASKLTQRSRRLRAAAPAEAAIDFSLSVMRNGGAISGELRVRELDGSETSRALSGASCDEVLSALALVGVVRVDPNAPTPLRTRT